FIQFKEENKVWLQKDALFDVFTRLYDTPHWRAMWAEEDRTLPTRLPETNGGRLIDHPLVRERLAKLPVAQVRLFPGESQFNAGTWFEAYQFFQFLAD